MKKIKFKLPTKSVNTIYSYANMGFAGADTSMTATTSQGDPTNSCTTILTTTHFV